MSQCSFNQNPQFSLQNEFIQVGVSENINLTIVNTDEFNHSFSIDGLINVTVAANSSIEVDFSINEAGTFRYYSNSFNGQNIGASGIIQVGYTDEIVYAWNLNDINSELSHDISELLLSDIPLEYNPNLFLINGFVFPNTLNDELGYVEQQVGDTIYISIINSGNMDHVLHFHGYHVELLDVKINSHQSSWIKDSVALKKGEAMTVKLVPHQHGIYPVHDHNLIAVTNAGFYPGGMITQLNISE